MSKVTVAALQTAITDDTADNVARVTAQVRDAAAKGAQIVLPCGLFEGHYFCRTQQQDDFARARPAEGHATLRHFQALANELGVVIPVSFFEQVGPEYYSSVVVYDADGDDLGLYRQSHIQDGPGYQEKYFFKPGNTGFKTYATRFGTIGVGLCWDQWFPEVARAMTLAGADVLLYPSVIGSAPDEPERDSRDSWQRAMLGHAVTNAVGVVAANRIGTEGQGRDAITFHGGSFVSDARGDKVAELGRNESGAALATLDLAHIRRVRASMGFFRDRRPSLYGPLTE